MTISYDLNEAYYHLRVEGLSEVLKALELSEDDAAEILLNNSPDRKVMDWFIKHQKDTTIDLAVRSYNDR